MYKQKFRNNKNTSCIINLHTAKVQWLTSKIVKAGLRKNKNKQFWPTFVSTPNIIFYIVYIYDQLTKRPTESICQKLKKQRNEEREVQWIFDKARFILCNSLRGSKKV